MSEQKIIQLRRGDYSEFVPSKLKPGEIMIIQNGDPESSSGKAIYACIAAGDVVRLATQDELNAYDQSAKMSAERAERTKEDIGILIKQMDDQLLEAQKAAENTEISRLKINVLKNEMADLLSQIQKDARNAQMIRSEIESTKKQLIELSISIESTINKVKTDLLNANSKAEESSHKIEVGGASTDMNGIAYIYLSDDFREALKINDTYRVFIQEEGDGKVYVDGKTDTFFIVSGTKDLAFSWLAIT